MKNNFFILTVIALSLIGCSHKFVPLTAQLPSNYLYGGNNRYTNIDSSTKWWRIFNDTTLDSLIDIAFINNQDALTAYSRIVQAELQVGVDRSQYLPNFSLNLSGEGEYEREQQLYSQRITQEYTISPYMSWEISLFGAMKNSTNAAKASLLAIKYNYEGIMLTLAADIATTYFQLIENIQNLKIAKQTYKTRNESASIIKSMVYHGLSTGIDLLRAEGLAESALSDINEYKRTVVQNMNALSVLLGTNPQKVINISSYGRGYYNLPGVVPSGLPSELLTRRPDIIESYALIVKASSEVGIAKANRFPSLKLTAAGGLYSNELHSFVNSPLPYMWSVVGSVAQPLFQFKKLRRLEQIAVENLKQSELAYSKTVITALSEVENALVSISTYNEQVRDYESLVLKNQKINNITAELYDKGLIDYLNLLDSERTLYESQIKYNALQQAKYSAYVELFKALGGGW